MAGASRRRGRDRRRSRGSSPRRCRSRVARRMLVDRFAGAEAVLLLDNCEHVVDAVADLVTAAARRRTGAVGAGHQPGAAGPRRRGGARARPAVAGRRGRRCSARAPPSARRHFALDDETAVVVEEVCRALDGLPLAIELAAARVRSLSVQEIARRLDDRFGLLRDPTSRAPDRRRGLAAAIGWSYDLLFPDDQRGLWALSVLLRRRARWPRSSTCSARWTCPRSPPSTSWTGSSTGRSSASTSAAGGAVRYRLLDSIRAFAARPARRGRSRRRGRARRTPRWFAGAADRCAPTSVARSRPRAWRWCVPSGPTSTSALAWYAEHDPLLGAPPGDRVRLDLGGARRRRRRCRPGPRRRDGRGCRRHRRERRPRRCSWPAGSRHPRATSSLAAAGPRPGGRAGHDARRRARHAPTYAGTPRSCGSSRAVRRTCSPRRRRASWSTATAGFTWETAASLLLAAYGSIMLGDTAERDRGRRGGRRPAAAAGGLLGARARRGHDRRHRPGRAPLRRRRHRAGGRRRRVRAARFPRTGRAAPDPPGQGGAAAGQPRRLRRRRSPAP